MDDESTDAPRYWIIVSSIDNWRRTAGHEFTVQGVKSRHRKKAELMRPGDKIAYYITGLKSFAGTATITSAFYEDHTPIWMTTSKRTPDEDYPYRVAIEPDVVLGDSAFVPAEGIAHRMIYARKWPAAHWTLAFQGNVHAIPPEDFETIRDALAAASSRTE